MYNAPNPARAESPQGARQIYRGTLCKSCGRPSGPGWPPAPRIGLQTGRFRHKQLKSLHLTTTRRPGRDRDGPRREFSTISRRRALAVGRDSAYSPYVTRLASRLGLIAALCAAPAGAACLAQAADDAGVRVYTNDDLEPLPESPPPPATEPEDRDGWAFVADHLEREYARIDAQRGYELERTRVVAETERSDEPVYSLPWSFYGWAGWAPPERHRPKHHARPEVGRLPAIRPIHAGPTQAQIQRARAMRYRGSDAFPN